MRFATTQKVTAAFALALIPLFVMGWFSYETPREFIALSESSIQSQQVLETLVTLLADLNDLETGQRGYLLTGDPRYLQSFATSKAAIDPLLKELSGRTDRNAPDEPHLAALANLAQQKIAELDRTIRLRQSDPEHGFDDALKIVKTDEGRQLMAEMRQRIRAIQDDEVQKRDRARQDSLFTSQRLLTIATFVTPLFMAIVVLSLWIILHDVTGRSRAEAEEERQRIILQTVLTGMSEGVVVADRKGRFKLFNPMARKLLGIGPRDEDATRWSPAENLLRADTKTPFPPRELPLARAVNGESVDNVPIVVRQNDSASERTINVTARPLWGRFEGGVVVLHDITEQKQAEQKLQESEARFRLIVEGAKDYGIFMLDPHGNVATWNAGAERITGYAAEEIVGRRFSSFYPQEAIGDGLPERELRVAAAEGRFEDEGWRIRKDGSRFWATVVIAALHDESGQLVGFSNITRDLTDRKNAELVLERARDAAEAANRAKGEFLANMSHEIRTPMNGIIGMTELLLDSELTPEQRESLTLVMGSAESLMTVINDILDFSKVEAGKLELDPIEFNLRDLFGDALKTLAIRAHRAGLELACDIDAEIPEILVGDPGRLRQVLVNLIANAVKFTPEGEIVVQARLKQADADTCRIEFSVTDTGIGIPPEKRTVIFEPFSQADGSTTRRFGGTGLGLTISARIVALMGGRIEVDSETGKGSKFHFEANFGLVKLDCDLQHANEPIDLRGIPVLVVDDNATNRRILIGMLRNWGMRPREAASGPLAIDELRRALTAGRPYRLLLVDQVMPGMDGFSLLEELGRMPGLAPSTIMMLTSLDHQTDGARCRRLKLVSYFVKPVKSNELKAAVRTALRGAPQEQPVTSCLRDDAEPASHAESQRPLRILLVEDNPINQRVALELLAKQGHTLSAAGNGKEALAALDRDDFDVVFMDVQMPEMNGFEATQAIRAREAGTDRHLPVVAMTAHAMAADRERCLAAGMDEYISKPIQTKELVRVLDTLFATEAVS
jgi:PAS domain S-box-containing protein